MKVSIPGKYLLLGAFVFSLIAVTWLIVPRAVQYRDLVIEIGQLLDAKSQQNRDTGTLENNNLQIMKPQYLKFSTATAAQLYILSHLPTDSLKVKVNAVASPEVTTLNDVIAAHSDLTFNGSFHDIVRLTHFFEFKLKVPISRLLIAKKVKKGSEELSILITVNSVLDNEL